jgi:hypothetical protein
MVDLMSEKPDGMGKFVKGHFVCSENSLKLFRGNFEAGKKLSKRFQVRGLKIGISTRVLGSSL